MELHRYAGIDYSLGQANFDTRNGIHYGIISLHVLHEYAIERFEAEYGEPTCPECGNEVQDYDTLDAEDTELADSFCDHHSTMLEYVCFDCQATYDSSDVYGDTPLYWSYEDTDYILHLDEYNDIAVFRSPYYTYAQYCSPCCPGAGHLENPCTLDSNAPRTYALGPEWFQDDTAPSPLYTVSDGNLFDPEMT